MDISKNNDKTAQEMQDKIFRKMPAEKKLAMLDGFQRFARELNSLGKKYGSNKTSQERCQSS
jgi:hypothetical protein